MQLTTAHLKNNHKFSDCLQYCWNHKHPLTDIQIIFKEHEKVANSLMSNVSNFHNDWNLLLKTFSIETPPSIFFVCFYNKLKILCKDLANIKTRSVTKENVNFLRHWFVWMFTRTILTRVPSASTTHRNPYSLIPKVQSQFPIYCLKSALYHLF